MKLPEYLDFYWGQEEEFELNDYLDDSFLTLLAKTYAVTYEGVTEGTSGYIRNDGYIFAEPADSED